MTIKPKAVCEDVPEEVCETVNEKSCRTVEEEECDGPKYGSKEEGVEIIALYLRSETAQQNLDCP